MISLVNNLVFTDDDAFRLTCRIWEEKEQNRFLQTGATVQGSRYFLDTQRYLDTCSQFWENENNCQAVIWYLLSVSATFTDLPGDHMLHLNSHACPALVQPVLLYGASTLSLTLPHPYQFLILQGCSNTSSAFVTWQQGHEQAVLSFLKLLLHLSTVREK